MYWFSSGFFKNYWSDIHTYISDNWVTLVKGYLLGKKQNEYVTPSIVLNMIRYVLVFKWIFQELLVRQTDIHTSVITGSIVHIGKGIFVRKNTK